MLKNKNFLTTIYLFIIGSLGIFSLLLVPFNTEILPPEIKKIILSQFSEFQLRILTLINPTILLLISILIGFFVNKNKPQLSYFHSSLLKMKYNKNILFYLMIGLAWGFLSSLLLKLLYMPLSNNVEILILEKKMPQFSNITKLLYGGITEEIIVRWGWLSLILFVCMKLIKKEKISFILAIFISSLLFGIGHLPIVLQTLNESVSFFLISYIIVLNLTLGVIFGHIFLKYNIETAIFTHIFFHIFTNLLQKF